MLKPLPLLSILGPTGAGKTAVALASAKLLLQQKKATGVDIISADSRQVYRDIPILSGADVPVEFVNFTYGQIRLHGSGMLAAHESWSLGQFQLLFRQVQKLSAQENRAVIVVGGTALYHKQLLQADPQLHIPPDNVLRSKLASLSVPELRAKLANLNPKRLARMNHSDQANPRRLVRAIEQEMASTPVAIDSPIWAEQKFLFVSAPSRILEQRIKQRVRKRFLSGAVPEVQRVLRLPDVSGQLLSTYGFSEIAAYLAGDVSGQECQANWRLREWQYAKSQQKWQKQFTNITNLGTAVESWRDDLLKVLDSVY